MVAGVLAMMCGYGAWRTTEGLPSGPAVQVAVIQGNNQDGAQWIPGAYLGQRGGPEQHIPMIRLRAVENHTWVIRATTTGVSAIVDPFGSVVARSRTFEPAVLDAAIVPLHVSTFYQRYGDVFAVACLVLSLLLILPSRPGSTPADSSV